MLIEKPIDSSYNYALSQLFSPSLLKKMHNNLDEQKIQDLIKSCNLYPDHEDWNLFKGLEITYNYLKRNYRCEYIYKNEIANQLLLKYHSDNSATLLKEVNSNSCIADVVIINGSTVAYEIKTELDSFERLANQIASYRILYDYIYIVTHANAAKSLDSRLDTDIGIIILDDEGILTTVKKASKNIHLFDPIKAVLTLRQAELVHAYQKYVGKLPDMGTAVIHKFCCQWYINLDKDDAHALFAEALKSRKPSTFQFDLIKRCNPSLKMLFLGKELSRKNCLLTIDKISTFD